MQHRLHHRIATAARLVTLTLTGALLLSTLPGSGAGAETPPLPPPAVAQFTNVTTYSVNSTVSVVFTYLGSFPPTVYLDGTTPSGPDVHRYVVAKKVGVSTTWVAQINNLPPEATLQVKIDNTLGQWTGTVTTMARYVTVKWTKLHAINDGDDWPSGCGEFNLNLYVDWKWDGSDFPDVCSGTTWTNPAAAPFNGLSGFKSQYRSDSLRLHLYVMETDTTPVADCGGSMSAACGPMVMHTEAFPTKQPGISTFERRMTYKESGTVKLDVVATVQINVEYDWLYYRQGWPYV